MLKTDLYSAIKSEDSEALFIHTSDYLRYLRRNKLHLLYWSLSVYLLLFTASRYLCSLMASFLSLWSVIFGATHANPQPTDSFQRHQHLEERNITCSQM